MQNGADSGRHPTIAVIAVHGVGEHKAGGSARAVADLLLRLRHGGGAAYTSFLERALHIPTKPARVSDRSRPQASNARRSIFTEQSLYMSGEHARLGDDPPLRATDSPNHQFMRAQLEQYESDGAPYETVRLEGERLSAASGTQQGAPDAGVHVYEMHWSDLSQIGSGGLGFFGALYQLLFHLAHLGRVAIEHARLEFRRSAIWRVYNITHQTAVRLLTVFVPVVWLVMLASILGLLVMQVSDSVKPYVVVVAGGMALASLAWIAAYRARDADEVRIRPFYGLAALAGTAALVFWIVSEVHDQHLDHIERTLVCTWLVLAGAILYVVFRIYDRVRPGAFAVGAGAYVLASLAVMAFVLPGETHLVRVERTVNLFEIETLAIILIWYALYLTGVLSGVLGILAARQGETPAARDRGRRVAWTGRATLSLSASLVLVVTFVMWAAILNLSRGMLPTKNAPSALSWLFDRHVGSYSEFFDMMLRVTAGPGFPLLVLLICVLVGICVAALFPAAVREILPPGTGERFVERSSDSAEPDATSAVHRQNVEDHASERLGRWLTDGGLWIGIAVDVLFIGTFVMMPVLNILDYSNALGMRKFAMLFETVGLKIILTAGGTLTAATFGLVAFRDRLDALALGFRPALDAALDVDNYLREHPRDDTPRARIAERYTSLLRYLCHWRGRDGEPYGAIVVVSHSQGTVITADLLSFIQHETDPELQCLQTSAGDGPEIYLFTMGSPLRQLYYQFFPHLFGWVRGDRDEWLQPTEVSLPPRAARAPTTPPASDTSHRLDRLLIADDASPNPWSIGVTRWVNAYRSGDYVGRSLWRLDAPVGDLLYRRARQADSAAAGNDISVVSTDAYAARREVCLGAGAHTHYWDKTARSVAIELDLLVADAVSSAIERRTTPTRELAT